MTPCRVGRTVAAGSLCSLGEEITSYRGIEDRWAH